MFSKQPNFVTTMIIIIILIIVIYLLFPKYINKANILENLWLYFIFFLVIFYFMTKKIFTTIFLSILMIVLIILIKNKISIMNDSIDRELFYSSGFAEQPLTHENVVGNIHNSNMEHLLSSHSVNKNKNDLVLADKTNVYGFDPYSTFASI